MFSWISGNLLSEICWKIVNHTIWALFFNIIVRNTITSLHVLDSSTYFVSKRKKAKWKLLCIWVKLFNGKLSNSTSPLRLFYLQTFVQLAKWNYGPSAPTLELVCLGLHTNIQVHGPFFNPIFSQHGALPIFSSLCKDLRLCSLSMSQAQTDLKPMSGYL